ncbi:proteins the FAD binding domain-containing protein [Aspergillus campestris IBT 28561]|uniref:D-lactate dehydrogenase (cytochrome) n=1 Tax=Aspergillus campestris (strain IBT 28561) TaxID=1392248 RepID=A0A2I1CSR1_ASPC2|nr:proteins the FAD binding domain-containing protein [Aspergillus campestris IBT 28561]PKY00663.1 proteins the FAD binding domain-containing protein [Aspergillus campestris IBT 28561]
MIRAGALPLRRSLRALESKSNFAPVISHLPTSRPRYLSASATRNVDEKNASFKNQLYESTNQRLKRERAEQERYQQYQTQTQGGRYAAMMFALVFFSSGAYYLGSMKPASLPASSTTSVYELDPPKHNVSPSNLQAAWVDFVEILGKENVSTNNMDLEAHSGSDWSSYSRKEDEIPFLILYPLSTEEVSKIMKVCHSRVIPVTPYSGGTSLEGHFAATRGGVCVDFRRMDQILELHKGDLDVVVQPALGWEELNERLSEDGLFFPPDPGPGAMIGGMVGTGCSGTNAYRYGTMREWVLSLTVVLADGTVIKTRQRPRKSSAGYDLTRLFIGSEGTLGLVTEATLKLTVQPKSQNVAVASFPTIQNAAECVTRVVEQGIPVAGVEILDDVQMKCINDSHTTSRQWKESPTLFFKFSGTPVGVKEQISMVQSIVSSTSGRSFEFARGSEEMRELWSARKEALWSVMAMRRGPEDHVWTTDVAVPMTKLPEIIEATKKDMTQSGLLAGICGHVGDGNFHAIILFNDQERKTAEAVIHRMVKRAVELEGTVTGEHGVGLIKRDYLQHELGESTVDAMRRLKLALDPLCLLNSDKVVRVQRPNPGEIKEW